jgi:hypothetical protein
MIVNPDAIKGDDGEDDDQKDEWNNVALLAMAPGRAQG